MKTNKSHILATVCEEFPSDGTHGENIKDLEKAFTLTSVPSWKPQFSIEYEGIITNKAEKKVYWMSNEGSESLTKVSLTKPNPEIHRVIPFFHNYFPYFR